VLSRAFARLVADLEIPSLRFHDLRHDAQAPSQWPPLLSGPSWRSWAIATRG
jgi:hypothetical protein